MKLEEGGKAIIAALDASGALLNHVSISHSYPHCWRHKTPVIFLATPQWVHLHGPAGPARQHVARHRQGAVDAGLG